MRNIHQEITKDQVGFLIGVLEAGFNLAQILGIIKIDFPRQRTNQPHPNLPNGAENLGIETSYLLSISFVIFEYFTMPFASVAVKRARYTPLAMPFAFHVVVW